MDSSVAAERGGAGRLELRHSVLLATVAVSIVLAERTSAQEKLGSERQDLRVLARDSWYVVTSPARADRSAFVPALATLGAIAVTIPFDSSVYAWMQRHPDAPLIRALTPIRERYRIPFYELGSVLYLMPISGALYTGGRLADDAPLRDAGLGCAASVLASSAFRVVIQLTVMRERPRQSLDPGHVSPPWRRRWKGASFPSGHVANPMACASFFDHRFSLGAAEPAMYGAVAAIGLARIADGQHWASDVVGGAAMGFAIGRAVAGRQHRRIGAGDAVSPRSQPARLPLLSFAF